MGNAFVCDKCKKLYEGKFLLSKHRVEVKEYTYLNYNIDILITEKSQGNKIDLCPDCLISSLEVHIEVIKEHSKC